MAETKTKLMDWTLADDLTTLKLTADGKDYTFLMTEYFKSSPWTKLEPVEKLIFINGWKQKVVDKLAGMKDYTTAEKIVVVLETARRLSEDRQWKAPSEGGGVGVPKHETVLKEFESIHASFDAKIKLAGKDKAVVAMLKDMKETWKLYDKTHKEWLAIKAAYVPKVKVSK